MCRSMADIRSTAAEIRRGKERKIEEEEDRKKETTWQKYNGPLLHRAAITKDCDCRIRGIAPSVVSQLRLGRTLTAATNGRQRSLTADIEQQIKCHLKLLRS